MNWFREGMKEPKVVPTLRERTSFFRGLVFGLVLSAGIWLGIVVFFRLYWFQ
jgi:hypothetical protein